MSRLNIKRLEDIERLTLTEFNYRLYALEYEMLEEEYERYKLAFAIRDVQNTENVGTEKKPKEQYVFQTINDVINYSDNIDRLNHGEPIRFENESREVTPEDKELFDVIASVNKSIQ